MLRNLVAGAWNRLSRARHRLPLASGDRVERLMQAAQMFDRGELEAARRICVALLAEDPELAGACNLLGEIAFMRREFALATEHFAEALVIESGNAGYHNNYGNAMAEQWRIDEAVASFRRAFALDSKHEKAQRNLLWLMNARPEFTAEERYREHCLWAEVCAEPLRQPQSRFQNRRDPGKAVRVGYVSADFRTHAVGYFIEPILAQHDSNKVEVVCYSGGRHADAATERMRAYAADWRDITPLSDEAVASRVRDDGIDILVDLAGHTRGNRLLVFAHKPAPVQVTFLGYPSTTGMSAIDYRLTDAIADPPGAERYYRERLVRLPHGLWCYRPHYDMPEVVAPPALAHGRITFGSMNSATKLNLAVIELWARILEALPDSMLLLATVPRGEFESRIREAFARQGIAGSRLQVHDRLDPSVYTELYERIDIALDPFPCNGGTTTCESLWMGVPVVSLAGEDFRSRAGLSLLTHAGLSRFVAADADAYVQIALGLARDIPALSELRRGLRDHLRASPLADLRAYVAALEQAYRGMWREWCRA
jgi:predicted O-linked N-acetylglucosamine transferase (SPINDLY family)